MLFSIIGACSIARAKEPSEGNQEQASKSDRAGYLLHFPTFPHPARIGPQKEKNGLVRFSHWPDLGVLRDAMVLAKITFERRSFGAWGMGAS